MTYAKASNAQQFIGDSAGAPLRRNESRFLRIAAANAEIAPAFQSSLGVRHDRPLDVVHQGR